MSSSKMTELRRLVAESGCTMAPGCHDTVSAKLIEAAGFAAVYMSGYSLQACGLGTPNIGVMTLTEYTNALGHIADILDVPLIGNGGSGFGGVLNVMRAVTEFEKLGISGIQIGDQAHTWSPHATVGGTLQDVETAATEIRAAERARSSEGLVIIAATYAPGVEPPEVVIARCQEYAAAGADLVMPMLSKMMPYTGSTTTASEREDFLRRVVAEVPCKIATHSPHGLDLELDAAADLGVSLYVVPQATLLPAAAAMRDSLVALRSGRISEFAEQRPPYPVREMSELLGIERYERLVSELETSNVGGAM